MRPDDHMTNFGDAESRDKTDGQGPASVAATIEDAIAIAAHAHKGQFDRSGAP